MNHDRYPTATVVAMLVYAGLGRAFDLGMSALKVEKSEENTVFFSIVKKRYKLTVEEQE